MHTRQAENLFRQRAIDSLATKFDGRPIAVIPKPWIWLLTLCIAFAVAACCFLWSVEYARKETVRGWLVVEPGVARVAHNDFATVVSIEHKAGDPVQQGDVILQLSSEVRLGNGSESAQQSLEYLEEQLASIDVRDALAREQFNVDHWALGQQLGGFDEEITALISQLREQQQRVRRSAARQEGLRSAFERGAIAKVELLRQEDELATMQQAVARLRQERNTLERQRQEVFAARGRLGIVLERSLAMLTTERSDLQQRITRYEEQRLLTVQSPVAGTLATLDVVAGSSILPQQLLATIIPEQSSLMADIYIPSRAVGLIQPGQTVKLLYDAFPHQQFGVANGEVDAIAGFVSLPKDMPVASGLREAAYKVRVRVTADHVEDGRGRYVLRPGMGLAAEIVLESRSLAHWFFAPLKARL